MESINLLLLYKILLEQHQTDYQQKLYQIKNIKLIDLNWVEEELIVHKWIGKLPKPKAGWTPGKYKYMVGPCNRLEKQLSYNPETGEVTEQKVKPYNKVSEIAAYHDICYDMERNKGDCDKEMVQSLDNIPCREMPKWGSTARFLINTKQKIGLGLRKNAKRR